MTKISDAELVTELEAGLKQTEIARKYGLTEGALSQRVKKLGILKERGAAMFAAKRLLKAELDAADLIQVSAQQLTDLLDDVQVRLHGDHQSPGYRQAYDRLRILTGGKRDLLSGVVALVGELRKQMELALDIREVEPGVAQEITRKLIALGALHSSLDVSRPTGVTP